jgi:hypothetical protein
LAAVAWQMYQPVPLRKIVNLEPSGSSLVKLPLALRFQGVRMGNSSAIKLSSCLAVIAIVLCALAMAVR